MAKLKIAAKNNEIKKLTKAEIIAILLVDHAIEESEKKKKDELVKMLHDALHPDPIVAVDGGNIAIVDDATPIDGQV